MTGTRYIIATLFVVLNFGYMAMAAEQSKWEPVPGKMMTKWGEGVTPRNAWRDYPRPQMVRSNWINLNGLWEYAITKKGADFPSEGDGEILVPYCLESPLSGVGRLLEPEDALWYKRKVDLNVPTGQRVILHFEAVDYEARVWVNDSLVGHHIGGNLPFSFDITDALKSENNELRVRVLDSTDKEGTYQLHGKQRLNNRSIFYTRVSGIWQTVWLEMVPSSYIERLKIDTEMSGAVRISTSLAGSPMDTCHLKAVVSLNGRQILTSENDGDLNFAIADPQLWSPDSPTLYDLTIQLQDESGVALDTVESYFGIREIGYATDETGERFFTLNGDKIFHWGPLDQGWWPDGLLTPPSEDAIAFELKFLKAAGFNMLRKHVKVEPRRYYAMCDRMGMLVWQDHVPGGKSPPWMRLELKFDEDWKEPENYRLARPGDPVDAIWPEKAHRQFMTELKGMVDNLYNHPSIVVWVPFNERWAQHETVNVGKWIQEYDPSRLINIASGGNFLPVGDIVDQHNYPDPSFPFGRPEYEGFIKVVGEFGGHGYAVKDHLWDRDKHNWGYGGLPESAEEYRERYIRTARLLGELKQKGISAGVYTQTTDVEGEINGLMTYDREVLKLSSEDLREIHREAGLLAP